MDDLKDIFNLVTNSVKNSTKILLSNIDQNERDDKINEMKQIMKDCIYSKMEYKNKVKILKRIQNENSNDKDIINMDKIFEERIKTDNFSVDFENNSLFKKFCNEIEDKDLSICIEQNFAIPNDPISKMPIKNPIKNTLCGHVYESNIKELIKSHKIKICPYVGCKNKRISLRRLKPDKELKEKIKNFQNENQSDDDNNSDEEDNVSSEGDNETDGDDKTISDEDLFSDT